MTRARRWTVLLLYALSITLSAFLLYLSLFHCQLHIFGQCTKSEGRSRQKSFSEYLATVVACTLTACSTCWLLANLRRIENSWLSNYNFLEMPTAVFCSLLAGVCGVVEIHYNFESSHGYNWSEKWTMITTDAVALVFLHAGLAFAH